MQTDNREDIEINLSDEEFLSIAKLAHERDITFNEMVAIILQDQIDRLNNERTQKGESTV